MIRNALKGSFILSVLAVWLVTFALAPLTQAADGSKALAKRPLMSAGRTFGDVRPVGFDRETTLSFIDYLSEESLENIRTFDKLSQGLNMTIENFFTFINKLLEEDNSESEEAGDADEEETLTVGQLGQLFGGVNASAVEYILQTLDTTAEELHAGFNTVDVIMVLLFVSSHLEANGVALSILDIITAFCDDDGFALDSDLWSKHIAAMHGVSAQRVESLMRQLEGSLDDIMGYVIEIIRPDACVRLVNGLPPAHRKVASRQGRLRGQQPLTPGSPNLGWGDERPKMASKYV